MSHARGLPSVDDSARYHRSWIFTVAALDALTGLFYVLGGAATSPTLLLMRQIMPMPVWGGALVLVGLLLVVRRHEFGGFGGGVVWLMFTAAAVITLVNRTTVAAGSSPMSLGLAGIHLLITYEAATGGGSRRRR